MIANQTQVGGTHYKNLFQHWDLAHLLDLGYFEGQITKYITRHRKKKGKEDLEKARHFTVKLIELARSMGRQPRHNWPTEAILKDYQAANELSNTERLAIGLVCAWTNIGELDSVLVLIDGLIKTYDPTPTTPTEPEKPERPAECANGCPAFQVCGFCCAPAGPDKGYVDQG